MDSGGALTEPDACWDLLQLHPVSPVEPGIVKLNIHSQNTILYRNKWTV